MIHIPPEIHGEILKFSAASAPANYRNCQLVCKEWLKIVKKLCPTPKVMFWKVKNIWCDVSDLVHLTNDKKLINSMVAVPVLPNGDPHGIGFRNTLGTPRYCLFRNGVPICAFYFKLGIKVDGPRFVDPDSGVAISAEDDINTIKNNALMMAEYYARQHEDRSDVFIHKSFIDRWAASYCTCL